MIDFNFPCSNELVEDFRSRGFVKVQGAIANRLVEQIRSDLEGFLEGAAHRMTGREINLTSDGQINSVHNLEKFEWSQLLLEHKSLRTFAAHLLGSEVEDFGAELFAKPSGTGIPVPDHQDDYYWCISDGQALTMWFALSPSDEKSGAVYYFPGSHLGGLKEHAPSGVPGSSQRIKDWAGTSHLEPEVVVLEPGDCVVHHARTVHGSGANESGRPRIGLTIRFKSVQSSVDADRQAKYLSDLKLQLEARTQA